MNDTFAYDLLDYPSHVIPQMHPSKLAAIARLHGVPAASPRACRLLEVGCGDALHLLSLALAYPDSRFVGVDMSRNAVERGEAMRRRLGLQNLELVTADLLTWDPGSEPYDYITAHGFFSWVPQAVRERLLALCNQALTASGIAYISYNAFPGCHVRRMLAEMMKFHVRDVSDAAERVKKAREFLVWLGTDTLDRDAYGETIRTEAERLLNNSHPSVLFHDDLSPVNQAFSLTDFAQLANAHDLGFMAEAEYHETNVALLPAESRERLHALGGEDRLVNDQYLDFLKGRRFRQSILYRGEHLLGGSIDHDAILGMDVVGHLRAEQGSVQADKHENVQEVLRFANSDGAILSTDQPVIKAVLLEVGNAFPLPRDVTTMLAQAHRSTASTASIGDDGAVLSQTLYKAFALGLVSLQVDAPRFAMTVTEKPVASPLARLQVEMGKEMVANLRPSMVSLDSRPALELLALLDGTRDHDAILEDLAVRMAGCEMPGGDDGELVRHDARWWKAQLGPTLADALQLSAKMALLLEP